MANMNLCVLMGNLTRDPELKFTPQGAAVCKLGIAVNRKYKGSDGQMVNDVQFFNIVAWNSTAENCAKFLTKGRPVCVRGRLQNRKWKTADGEERTTTEIVADEVQFLGSGSGNGDGQKQEQPKETRDDDSFVPNGRQQSFDDTVPF